MCPETDIPSSYGECLKSEKPAKSATIRDSDSTHTTPNFTFYPRFYPTFS